MKNVWNIKEKWSTVFHGISWRICPEKLLEKKKKFRLYYRNSVKIPGGKIQYCPRNFTNIAEINQKIHGIRRKLWWNLPKKNPDFFTRVVNLNLNRTNFFFIVNLNLNCEREILRLIGWKKLKFNMQKYCTRMTRKCVILPFLFSFIHKFYYL